MVGMCSSFSAAGGFKFKGSKGQNGNVAHECHIERQCIPHVQLYGTLVDDLTLSSMQHPTSTPFSWAIAN